MRLGIPNKRIIIKTSSTESLKYGDGQGKLEFHLSLAHPHISIGIQQSTNHQWNLSLAQKIRELRKLKTGRESFEQKRN